MPNNQLVVKVSLEDLRRKFTTILSSFSGQASILAMEIKQLSDLPSGEELIQQSLIFADAIDALEVLQPLLEKYNGVQAN